MSDTESIATAPAAHPAMGGKSIPSLERPRYKSWRKKYRKMRHDFDTRLEENKKLFKDERKLEGIAKRLREELDGLLDLCLDMNQNPNVPPELRFDVSHQLLPARMPSVVPENITPEAANDLLLNYTAAVTNGQIPALDLHVVRDQIETRLAARDVAALADLESRVPHAIVPTPADLPEELRGDEPLSFLVAEQEADYLLRLDARLGDQFSFSKTAEKEPSVDDKPWAELTPREQERQAERSNPQSQHNWLKQHFKIHEPTTEALDELDGFVPHERGDRVESGKSSTAGTAGTTKKRGNKNLAKQVGDRAVERAREGWSPGGNYTNGFDEDELSTMDTPGAGSASGRKRTKDVDGAYRAKGGRGGASKGKRKRVTEDALAGGEGKKARLDAGADSVP